MSVPVGPAEFGLLAAFVREHSGMDLDAGKRYLVETRIGPLLGKFGCSNYSELHAKAVNGGLGTVGAAILDAITTHETSFFRDRKPFDLLRHKLVPDLLGADPGRSVSIWSAACSTGQEAYSIGICLKEILFDTTKYRIRILGTDISRAAVDRANKGEFSAFEMGRGLSPDQAKRHFREHDGRYLVDPEIRGLMQFRTANLLERNAFGPFDIIFCRNVAIYFPEAQRKLLFGLMEGLLKPGGALIIGSTESLSDCSRRFVRKEHHGAAYYALGRAATDTVPGKDAPA